MMATHETLWLEAAGTSAAALTPGRVQRALRSGLRLFSEAVGTMSPIGRGRVSVEIALPQALDIGTPLTFSVLEQGHPSLFTLRRSSDPGEEESGHLRVTWSGSTCPTVGQVIQALTSASDDRFHTGDLGSAFEGRNLLLVTVSEGLYRRLNLPHTANVSGLKVTIAEDIDPRA